MKTTKFAALFGGSGNNRKSIEYQETIRIGSFLAKQGYTVKNGGYGGLMEAVSNGVTKQGGKAIGVTCRQVGPENGNSFLSETITTETLYDRLKLLLENTEVFVVQRGGIGTLSEAFLALDIIRKEDRINQPRIFFVGEFWNDIISILQSKLIPTHEHYLFKVVKGYAEFKECFSESLG